jgi:hypothetical protein
MQKGALAYHDEVVETLRLSKHLAPVCAALPPTNPRVL